MFAVRDTLSLRSKSPGGDRPSCAAAKNYEIVFFQACSGAHVLPFLTNASVGLNAAAPKFTLNRLHQMDTARYFARSKSLPRL